MRENLFDLAMENGPMLQGRYDTLVDELRAAGQLDPLENFLGRCENQWRLSMNWKGFQVLFFLQHQLAYNRYRYHHLQQGRPVYHTAPGLKGGGTTVNWNVYLDQDSNDKWAQKRRVYNEWIDREEDFAYSALYVRGRGAIQYGNYAVVLSRNYVLGLSEVAFLRGDSLQFYFRVDDEMILEKEKLKKDLATRKHVMELLALKKHESLRQSSDVEACIDGICTYSEYIEAQIGDAIAFAGIEKVLINLEIASPAGTTGLQATAKDLAVNLMGIGARRAAAKTPQEQNRTDELLRICSELKNNQIPFEYI